MPSVEGFGARRAALQLLDAVLRRGQTLEGAAARSAIFRRPTMRWRSQSLAKPCGGCPTSTR